MRSSRHVLVWLVILFAFHSIALAQSSTEDCIGQPSLDGGDTFGFNEGPTPTSNDFAMAGAGCNPWVATNCGFNDGFDRVVCFTPTNSFDVLVQVVTGGGGAAAHVYSGICAEPATCVASISEDDNAVLLPMVSLTAGIQYCVVAERCGIASVSITINQINATDCGPLPVSLQTFAVE